MYFRLTINTTLLIGILSKIISDLFYNKCIPSEQLKILTPTIILICYASRKYMNIWPSNYFYS